MHVLLLGRTVAGQELAADVDDGFVVPHDAHARLLGDFGHHGCLEVLLVRVTQELVHVGSGDGAGHALLRLGDGKLGTVEAVVLLRNLVQVDAQAVGQLADGHGHAAGAEVVAALDKATYLAATEQALDLALLGRVALLYLGTAVLKRFQVVLFGAARGAANAVAAGAAAQQHHHVARSRRFAANVVSRRGRHHSADFHALGNVARVVQLVHLARGQADLVTVAGVTGSSRGDQLALRQLARQCFGHGHQRVRRTGDAHGLVHVAAARQGVTDSAAQARGRAAERLDFRGVVVRFVLEQVQPVLVLAVHVHLALHRAGVDFLGLVQAGKDALGLQPLRADGAHVHKAHGLGVATQFVAHVQVLLVRGLHALVIDGNVRHFRAERGVAAVVRPVRIDHLDFGDGGATTFALEVLLAKRQVSLVHGQLALVDEALQLVGGKVKEAVEHLDRRRLRLRHGQRFAHIKRRLARLDGVDDVVLDSVHVFTGQRAGKQVHLRAAHLGTLALADQLDAFAGRSRTLIELAGQKLHGEHVRAIGSRQLGGSHVNLRLAEHGGDALLEQLPRDALHVVAVHQAQALKRRDTQDAAQLVRKLLGLNVEAGLLLHIDAGNHGRPFCALCAGRTRRPSENANGHRTGTRLQIAL